MAKTVDIKFPGKLVVNDVEWVGVMRADLGYEHVKTASGELIPVVATVNLILQRPIHEDEQTI